MSVFCEFEKYMEVDSVNYTSEPMEVDWDNEIYTIEPMEVDWDIAIEEKETIEIAIYTDGSKKEKRVGWGFAVYEGVNATKIMNYESGRLDIGNSAYQAELKAIQQAIKFLVDLPERKNIKIGKAKIYSDCKNVLDDINRGMHDEIQDLLETVNVEFEHVFGHCCIEGNEIADKLAKGYYYETLQKYLITKQKTDNVSIYFEN